MTTFVGTGCFMVVGTGKVFMGSLTLLSAGGHNFAVGQQGWRSGKNPDVKGQRGKPDLQGPTRTHEDNLDSCCPSPRRPGKPTEEAGPLLNELHLAPAWSSEELGEP